MPTTHLYQGDALRILPTIPAGAADCVITDPPYNSGGRTASERRTQTARDKYVSSDAQHDLVSFDGDSRDQRGYTNWLSQILAECYRIALPGATALVFSDWRQLPATSDALQAAGWTWRGIVVWHKPIARPRRGGFSQNTEYVLWASHGVVLADRNPVCVPGLVSASQPRGNSRQHITQKPDEVMDHLVQLCPRDGTVLDPFAGSGSTAVAAVRAGRSFVGIEQSTHYHAIASGRIDQAMVEVT